MHKVRRREEGTVISEFVLTFFVLLLLIIGGVDLTRVLYQSAQLRFALTSNARWAVLRQTDGTLSREDSIKQRVSNLTAPLGVHVGPNDVRVCPVSDPNCTVDDASADFIAITATQTARVLFGGFNVGISETVIARNEPE